MKIERKWSMANKWTFLLKPVKQLLEEEGAMGMFKHGFWCDPFSGEHSPADTTNDLNPKMPSQFHDDALIFLKSRGTEYDGVLYDPPYSFRQLKECYEGLGKSLSQEQTKMSYFSGIKDEIARIIKPDGKAICFGWNSMGLGKSRGFQMESILLIAHGGSRNDTIVTVERKSLND